MQAEHTMHQVEFDAIMELATPRPPCRQSVMHITASIVQRAVFSKLDCGSGELSSHVGFSYEAWLAEQVDNPAMSRVYTPAFIVAVRDAIENELGLTW